MSGSAENYVVNGQTVSIGSDVSSAGVTGSSNTILVGTDSSVGIVGSNNVVAISNGDAVGLEAGSGNFIVGSNGVVVSAISVSATTMFGNNNIIYTGLNNSINVYGNANDINNSDGDYTGVLSGINNIISGSDGVIETDAGVLDTYIVGSNNFFAAGSGNTAQILGSNNAIYLSNGDVLVLDSGSANNITSNDGNIVTSADIYGTTITGSFNTALFATANSSVLFGDDNTLTVGNDDSITLNGNANILSVGSDDQITVAGTSQYISGSDNNSIVLNGSNGTLNFDSGNQIEITGSLNVTTLNSNNTLTIDGFNNIVRSTGSDNTIVLSGDYNVVRPGYTASIDILSGNNDTINAISSMLSLSNDVQNVLLVGTFDTVLAGANDGINLGGLGTDVTIGSLGYVGIVGGANDTVNMTGGILNTLNDIENINLIGSNNQVGGGSSISIDISGNGNDINAGAGSSVTLGSGTNDTVNLSNGQLDAVYGVTNLSLNGSYDGVALGTATAASNLGIDINGSDDLIISAGIEDFVAVTGGINDTVNLSGGMLQIASGVTGVIVIGSNDTINASAGAQITINGNNDVINMVEGSTLTIGGSDSGDTINMIGGLLVIGSTLISNIAINGTGDELSGVGASLAGPITITYDPIFIEGQIFYTETIITVPKVVYNSGDIQDLVTYFQANPNLSMDQIAAAESDPDYQSNLNNFLSSANVYGSANSLPSNILSMLEGYSSIFMAIYGVEKGLTASALATDMSEEAYIQQQLSWVEANYPIPMDELPSVIQNLSSVVFSTVASTSELVNQAIGLLESGRAGASGGNQTPMLNDTAAIMELDAAENPTAGNFGEEVYTPGRSGHWQVIFDPATDTLTDEFKSPPLVDTILDDVDTYLAPIIDIISIVSLNPEFIALTGGIGAAATTGVEVAASAISLTEAGQDFASGADIQGVFGVIGAIGGALQDFGGASGAVQFGEGLSDVSAIGTGVYDVVNDSGNILGDIVGGLGALSGAAGAAGLGGVVSGAVAQQLQTDFIIGESLAESAQAIGTGNILSALDALTQAASASGILSQIIAGAGSALQEVESIWNGFEQQLLNVTAGTDTDANPNYSSTALTQTPYQSSGNDTVILPKGVPWGNSYSLIYNANNQVVGIDFLDPSQADNSGIISGVDVLANSDGIDGPIQYIVVGHGNSTGLYSSPNSTAAISPESTLASMEQNQYVPGENIEVFACNAGSQNTNTGTSIVNISNPAAGQAKTLLVPTTFNGNPQGSDFAQTLATLSDSQSVMAFNGYEEMYPGGAYFVSQNDLPNGSVILPSSTPAGLIATPSGITPGSVQYFSADTGP